MSEQFTDYGVLMNQRTFRIYVQDYYTPVISPYFTGLPTPKPIQNGVEVDADVYNQHPGVTELAEDGIVRHVPLQVGSEFDMTVSYVNCASIVDMCNNEITFQIADTEDIGTILDIMYGYKRQISVFENKNKLVKSYQVQLNAAIHLQENNQDQRERAEKADRIASGEEQNKPVSLVDMLGSCF